MQAKEVKELLHINGDKPELVSFKRVVQALDELIQANDDLIQHNKDLLKENIRLNDENAELKAQLERLA